MWRPTSRTATSRSCPNALTRKRDPSGQSRRRSEARTSQCGPKPYVTTRADVCPAIHVTCGSSPFSTAMPDAGSARTIRDFSARMSSSVPSTRVPSLPIEVTTTTSGRVILA